jgi:hypothetical protein
MHFQTSLWPHLPPTSLDPGFKAKDADEVWGWEGRWSSRQPASWVSGVNYILGCPQLCENEWLHGSHPCLSLSWETLTPASPWDGSLWVPLWLSYLSTTGPSTSSLSPAVRASCMLGKCLLSNNEPQPQPQKQHFTSKISTIFQEWWQVCKAFLLTKGSLRVNHLN